MELYPTPENPLPPSAECLTVITRDKLKLRGEFLIQHGERQPWLRPTSDGSGFARTGEFREFYDDLLQQPGPGGAGSYAAPLWLLSPPTNPAPSLVRMSPTG